MPRTRFRYLLLAMAGACAAPAAAKSLIMWDLAPLVVEGTVALFLGLALGLPSFLLLRRFRRVGPITVLLCGVLIAVLPLAALTYPENWRSTRATVTLNGATTMINGRATNEGWRQYAVSAGYRALYGALAAIIFVFSTRGGAYDTRNSERPSA